MEDKVEPLVDRGEGERIVTDDGPPEGVKNQDETGLGDDEGYELGDEHHVDPGLVEEDQEEGLAQGCGHHLAARQGDLKRDQEAIKGRSPLAFEEEVGP